MMQSGSGSSCLFPRAEHRTKSPGLEGARGEPFPPLTINILQIPFDAGFANGFFQDAIINRLFSDLGK